MKRNTVSKGSDNLPLSLFTMTKIVVDLEEILMQIQRAENTRVFDGLYAIIADAEDYEE